MRAEHAGFGSYTYECRKQDCWHCEMMGLKPIYEEVWPERKKVKLLPVKNNSKRRYKIWNQGELNVLINNPFATGRQLRKTLRRFKIQSIATKMSRLREQGVLPRLRDAT